MTTGQACGELMHGHICQDTKKLVALDTLLLEVEKLLNAANVPLYATPESSRPMTLVDRLRKLVSQRDEARLLAETTARELATHAEILDRAIGLANKVEPPGDWACAECRPYSDMLHINPGFQCHVHAIRTWAAKFRTPLEQRAKDGAK